MLGYILASQLLMPERFAIAVQWPDDSRPFLVHLQKPYFVAEVRRFNDTIVFVTTLGSKHLTSFPTLLDELLPAASNYFAQTMNLSVAASHFIKGSHGRDFPQFLMAKTTGGDAYIVEPDHPSPLVEVKEPLQSQAKTLPRGGSRFDTVTQYRLAQMRKYYQQFIERQQGNKPATLVVPALK